MKVAILIPARYKSTRFPGKPLVDLCGLPMIARVARICDAVVGSENVYVATDDDRIADACVRFNIKHVMTDENHATGTDRCAEAIQKIGAYDLYINVQGDEPLIAVADIKDVIEYKKSNMQTVVNAYTDLDAEFATNLNIPKVAVSRSGRLLYMSRSVLPGTKGTVSQSNPDAHYLKQVCIYAYTAEELGLFSRLNPKGPLEASEDIEILRFIENDYSVSMVKVSNASLAIDCPEDVPPVLFRIREIEGDPIG